MPIPAPTGPTRAGGWSTLVYATPDFSITNSHDLASPILTPRPRRGPNLSPPPAMMPGLRYPEASQHNYAAGIKRSASDFDAHDSQIAKRRRIVHHIKHKQPWEVDPTLTPQDEKVFGSQMLRAISLTLGAVGFDGAMPSALEMFRGQIEECTAIAFLCA